MGSIVGFTISNQLSTEQAEQVSTAQNRALSRFTHLERTSLSAGHTTLHLWGHANLQERIHKMPDGSLLALIGSPLGKVAWQEVQDALLNLNHPQDFKLPWDGRFNLVQVSGDGKCWRIWNDWLGSIPIFYSQPGKGRLASTLEPAAVAAAGCTTDHFFLPGLVSLLINGYGLADWTIFKNLKTILPDHLTEWDEHGLTTKELCTVLPSQDRWEASWDDLVDEMHELSRAAIADVLKTSPTWIIPLSSGLDSRLIAGVAADLGVNACTYAWGPSGNTDVYYSHKIAQTLGFPWKHIETPNDFLVKYTPQWYDWFGTSIHFQGMYLMSFLDGLQAEPNAPMVTGFIGDVLAGDGLKDSVRLHSVKGYQVDHEWYSDWQPSEIRKYAKFPVEEALEANATEIRRQLDSVPGASSPKLEMLQLWNRQHLITSYVSILMDYWRGVATPFINRSYARFCLSLPRAALDRRRLIMDVFRRYYGRLAVIPGSYGQEPMIVTGKYLLQKRISSRIPPFIHRLLKGSVDVQTNVDAAAIQTYGKKSFWPLFDVWEEVGKWIDLDQLEKDYHEIMSSQEDSRPLRRLQAVQSIAPRFLPALMGLYKIVELALQEFRPLVQLVE